MGMNYLKKFNITEENIKELEQQYNEGIIEFITNNEAFITEKIEYLYSENIKNIYLLMKNNIRVFLETKLSVQKKIERLKQQGFSSQMIEIKLMQH